MTDLHLPFWPASAPRRMWVPDTTLSYNVEVAAARFPEKAFMIFYDTAISYRRFREETERVAGYLQQACGVKQGDRVLLDMQNSPQWITAFYGILRAGAVVVPVNPMNLANELRHYAQDSGAKVAFVAQELYPRIQPLLADDSADGDRRDLQRLPGSRRPISTCRSSSPRRASRSPTAAPSPGPT